MYHLRVMSDPIEKDKYVALTYRITDESGDVLETCDVPVTYIHGRESQVIPRIVMELEGRREGDELSILLTPEEGFGEHQEELTFTDDLERIPKQFHQIGAEVEFRNDVGENRTFRVTRIEDGKLTVDGNHPFAGKVVIYNIRIVTVRDATPAEMDKTVDGAPSLH